MSYNELIHTGVLGMKWGIRKNRSSGDVLSKSGQRMIKKDAKRYADAKMFYGKTAGTKRKLLKAELDKKKKNMPGYEEAFNKAVNDVDFAKSAKKAVRTRKTIDVTHRVRVTTKQILNVTGPLTVAVGAMLYAKNKEKVDAFVASKVKDAAWKVKEKAARAAKKARYIRPEWVK